MAQYCESGVDVVLALSGGFRELGPALLDIVVGKVLWEARMVRE